MAEESLARLYDEMKIVKRVRSLVDKANPPVEYLPTLIRFRPCVLGGFQYAHLSDRGPSKSGPKSGWHAVRCSDGPLLHPRSSVFVRVRRCHYDERIRPASAAFTAGLARNAPSTSIESMVSKASSGGTSSAMVARPSTLICSVSPAARTVSRS